MDIIERLNIVQEGIENGLNDWPLVSQLYEYKTAIAEITSLRQQVAELTKQKNLAVVTLQNLSLYIAHNGDDWVSRESTEVLAAIKSIEVKE